MQQPECGEVRGCCVLRFMDLTPCHKIPHSERKPPPDHCGDTQVEREHLCRKKWVESLKAVMEAPRAVREWCGGQRAWRGCKDQERSDQSIGCCRFPPGLHRMCLSDCQTGGGKKTAHAETVFYVEGKNKCLKSVHMMKIAAICAAASTWIFLFYSGYHSELLPCQRAAIHRLLEWHMDVTSVGILSTNQRKFGCRRLSHAAFSSGV